MIERVPHWDDPPPHGGPRHTEEKERKLLHAMWKDGHLNLWTSEDQNYWFERKSITDVAQRYAEREDPDTMNSELYTALEVIERQCSELGKFKNDGIKKVVCEVLSY
jgi:hypothetical protein